MTNKRTPERCGNCKHHLYDDMDGRCVCVKPESEWYTTYTEHDDVCEEWEKKPTLRLK